MKTQRDQGIRVSGGQEMKTHITQIIRRMGEQ